MIEALWSVKFITAEESYGAGVVVFETNRIFGSKNPGYDFRFT